mgnify:CR=1 FL=1
MGVEIRSIRGQEYAAKFNVAQLLKNTKEDSEEVSRPVKSTLGKQAPSSQNIGISSHVSLH